jgi:hypothetical protein
MSRAAAGDQEATMRIRWSAALTIAAITQAAVASTAAAQNETALRTAFEGRTITLRIDMPATSQGVDVFPQESMPVDFREVAQRLKDNGTAIKMGQPVMVTKVVVKKDHIEFQLGGGGYGTFGDWMTNGSNVSTVSTGETQEEKDLRAQIKNASGDEKKRLQRELDKQRSTRERENATAAAEAQQANIAREASIRTKRLEAGSRFNVRYKHGIPTEALTPDAVMKSLAQYADFTGIAGAPSTVASAPNTSAATPGGAKSVAPSAERAAAAVGISALKKGMSLADVEAALGPAATATEAKEGAMTVTKRTYRTDGTNVSASFVGGVLIDYSITPR